MSNETAIVIEKQIDLMSIDLTIVLTKLKVKEYRIKAEVLEARANIEEHKITMLERQKTGVENG